MMAFKIPKARNKFKKLTFLFFLYLMSNLQFILNDEIKLFDLHQFEYYFLSTVLAFGRRSIFSYQTLFNYLMDKIITGFDSNTIGAYFQMDSIYNLI